MIQEGQVFTGETEVAVKTDKFLVEDVTVFEEPALRAAAEVEATRSELESLIRAL